MTNITQLTEKLNEASENISTRLNGLENNFQSMDQQLIKMQKSKSGFYDVNSLETKTDPAFSTFLTKGHMPQETKDLSITNDGQNVTVRSEWSNYTANLVREYSPIRQVAGGIATSKNEVEILINRGEPDSAWIGELDTRTETATAFMTRQKIAVHENYAYPSITLSMIEDSELNVEQWLQQQVAQKFTRQEAAAFVNGDGTGKPRGILNYGHVKESSFTWGADPATYTLGASYSGVAGDIGYSDALFDLVDSLKADYLSNSSWLMTRAFRNKIRKLKDSQGRYLLQPSIAAAAPDTLLGYPLYIAEDMPAIATDGVGALFGDFNQGYKIVDRSGLTIQRDAVTKIGWIRYYVRRRIGGALVNPEAIKVLVLGTEPA
jgi:HK97 family phage major capsid protein